MRYPGASSARLRACIFVAEANKLGQLYVSFIRLALFIIISHFALFRGRFLTPSQRIITVGCGEIWLFDSATNIE